MKKLTLNKPITNKGEKINSPVKNILQAVLAPEDFANNFFQKFKTEITSPNKQPF